MYRGTEIVTNGEILVAKLQAGKLTDNENFPSINHPATKFPNQKKASSVEAGNETGEDSESSSESDWDEDFDDDEEYSDSEEEESHMSNDEDVEDV